MENFPRWKSLSLHGIAVFGITPSPLKFMPTPRRCVPHGQFTNHCLVVSIAGHISLTDISSNSNVNEDSKLTHPPRARWLLRPHNRPPINQPDQTSPTRCLILIPDKVIPHPHRRRNVRDRCLKHTMLIPVLAIEVSPMQTGMVNRIPIPRLHDIDLPILRPPKRISRQQPKRRPNPPCHRRRDSSRQTAPRSTEDMVTRKPSACEFLRRVRMAVVDQRSHDQCIALRGME